jgi:signal transduction histidine kinase
MKPIGLRKKLIRVFALQVLLISAATVIGIYATYRIFNDVLIREALNDEAAHYWALFEADPAQPLPNTANLRGYLEFPGEVGDVPASLRGQPTGYGRMPLDGNQPLVHVSEHGDARLFLVFLEDRVSRLVLYFGIGPLAVVLLGIYGLSFFAYRLSQRAISPIVQLANHLASFDFSNPEELRLDLDAHKPTADAEVATMIEAVTQFARRVEALVKRERTFTRDASHELRTPVAVLKGSLDLLDKNEERSATEQAALRRMRKTVDDMEALLETLLLLARGNEIECSTEPVFVNDIVSDQLAQLAPLAERHCDTLHLNETARLEVIAPPKVIAILTGNLLRNAVNYTRNGDVTVTIDSRSICIEDTGMGMREDELEDVFEPFYRGAETRNRPDAKGHGLGLAIVKRLTNQFGWLLSIVSQPGKGTRVLVEFGA